MKFSSPDALSAAKGEAVALCADVLRATLHSLHKADAAITYPEIGERTGAKPPHVGEWCDALSGRTVALYRVAMMGPDVAPAVLRAVADAIEAAAGATVRAAAESVGLGDQLGIIATAYDEAKKSADSYVAIAYAQQNSFLEGQVAADNYQQSLAALQYSTDFTASNLQNVAQALQGQVGAAFTAAAAAAMNERRDVRDMFSGYFYCKRPEEEVWAE